MPMIDQQAFQKLEPELMSGESISWSGMPDPSVIFHSEDWFMIPFSLLWGGFAIFWEASVAGLWGSKSGVPWNFGVLWGVPFVLIGQYFIWGRLFVDAWLKRRTYYAITDRRVLFLQEGFRRKSRIFYLDSIGEFQREGSLTGTIWLGSKPPLFTSRNQSRRSWSAVDVSAPVPALVDVADVDTIYRLLLDLRQKRAATKSVLPS